HLIGRNPEIGLRRFFLLGEHGCQTALSPSYSKNLGYFNRLLGTFQTFSQGRTHTPAELVAGSDALGVRIKCICMDEPDPNESLDVWEGLDQFQRGNRAQGLTTLETFITNHANSVWVPSLRCALGAYYRSIGRYTPAIDHWDAA